MSDPQLYRLCDILAPGVDALLAGRPDAGKHIARGRYGDAIFGWGAQMSLVRARLAKEILAARRPFASGQALVELAGSEFDAALAPDPRKAIGEVQFNRTVINSSPTPLTNFTVGVIPNGMRLRLAADPSRVPPVREATYATTEAAVFGSTETQAPIWDGSHWVHQQNIIVPVEAAQVGPDANTPNMVATPYLPTLGDAIFDTTITINGFAAAGGSNGVVDDQLRALCGAMASGRWGPTAGAAIAGALSEPSVRRIAWVDDTRRAIGKLFVADESWGASNLLMSRTKQRLLDKWLGFGARVDLAAIVSVPIHVSATVVLRSLDFAGDTTDIQRRIVKALTAYFDDRPNFWTWRLDTIGGEILLADSKRRLLSVPTVAVTDADGTVLAEPDATPSPDALIHWWLVGNPVTLTFEGPS